MPTSDLTIATSVELIVPFAFTSSRKVRATDRHAHLRFGQGNIGGIDHGIAIHITNQHAHRSGNVAHVCTIIHVKERDRDYLSVGNASEINGDRRCSASH